MHGVEPDGGGRLSTADRKPLSFREAAGHLGIGTDRAAALRLERIILGREREIGRRIALRGRGKHKPRRRVTLAAISRHLPELRPSPFEKQRAEFRLHLLEIDEHIMRTSREQAEAAIGELVDPKLQELREADQQLAADLNELASRLKKTLSKRT